MNEGKDKSFQNRWVREGKNGKTPPHNACATTSFIEEALPAVLHQRELPNQFVQQDGSSSALCSTTDHASTSFVGNYTVQNCSIYSASKHRAITRAYIYVNTVPITGSDQKESAYYKRIWESYKTKKPSDVASRPIGSVTTRCKAIVKECIRFAACFQTVKGNYESGHIEEVTIRLATAM